jgi:aryl-alcohol dehydrogenase
MPQRTATFFGRDFAGSRADGSSPCRAAPRHIHGNFFGQSSATYALCNETQRRQGLEGCATRAADPWRAVQTAPGAVINALKVGVGKSIVIFGTGSVGLSAIMAARVVVRHDHIVDLNGRLAPAGLGATHTIHAGTVNAVDAVMRITGSGAHFALETTANPKVIRQAVDCLTFRGECGLVGASDAGTQISLDVLHLMTAGRKVRGIVEGDSVPQVFIPQLIDLHLQGRFPYDRHEFYDFKTSIGRSPTQRLATIKPVCAPK